MILFSSNLVACRSIIFFRFFRFLHRILPSFPCFHHGEDASCLSFRALSFSFPFHTVNRYITHSLPSISSSIFQLSLFLSFSLAFARSLALSFSLSLALSFSVCRSHSFALIEYNSYVITGGRHPMSISSGMRDERFSSYRSLRS